MARPGEHDQHVFLDDWRVWLTHGYLSAATRQLCCATLLLALPPPHTMTHRHMPTNQLALAVGPWLLPPTQPQAAHGQALRKQAQQQQHLRSRPLCCEQDRGATDRPCHGSGGVACRGGRQAAPPCPRQTSAMLAPRPCQAFAHHRTTIPSQAHASLKLMLS